MLFLRTSNSLQTKLGPKVIQPKNTKKLNHIAFEYLNKQKLYAKLLNYIESQSAFATSETAFCDVTNGRLQRAQAIQALQQAAGSGRLRMDRLVSITTEAACSGNCKYSFSDISQKTSNLCSQC